MGKGTPADAQLASLVALRKIHSDLSEFSRSPLVDDENEQTFLSFFRTCNKQELLRFSKMKSMQTNEGMASMVRRTEAWGMPHL